MSVTVEAELIDCMSRSLSLAITFFGSFWKTCHEYDVPFPITFAGKDISYMSMKEKVMHDWLVIYEAVFCYHVRNNISVASVKDEEVVVHRIFHALVCDHNLFLGEEGEYVAETERLIVYLTAFLDLVNYAKKKSFFPAQDFLLDIMVSRLDMHVKQLTEFWEESFLFIDHSTTYNYFVDGGRIDLFKSRTAKLPGTNFSVSEDLKYLPYLLCVSLQKYKKKRSARVVLANMIHDFEDFKELQEKYDAWVSANVSAISTSVSAVVSTSTSASASSSTRGPLHTAVPVSQVPSIPPVPSHSATFAPAPAIVSASTSQSASSSTRGPSHGITSPTASGIIFLLSLSNYQFQVQRLP